MWLKHFLRRHYKLRSIALFSCLTSQHMQKMMKFVRHRAREWMWLLINCCRVEGLVHLEPTREYVPQIEPALWRSS